MSNFSKLDVHPGILDFFNRKGIHTLTEIQEKSIPLLIHHEGDFVARSATGTGKTYAFGAPLLSRININSGRVQAVVLVPTRELCEQVGNELIDLGSEIDGLEIESIYGGVSLKSQIHDLSNGTQVVVATPGRLMDLVQRKVVDLSSLKFVIFDEADEMLLKGFSTDIDKILNSTNRQYSTWLFSATMPDEVHIIVKKYLNKELKKVFIGEAKGTNKDIEHQVICVTPEEKQDVLLHFLGQFGDQRGIIFCRTKSGVQKLYKQLSSKKISSGAIHGDLPQGLRNKVMDQFREGHIKILLATDVAARGVDVEKLNFVIQYHLPDTSDAFTHRSGRTSRAGNIGVNLTFIFEEEREKFNEIKGALKFRVTEVDRPSVKDQLMNKAVLWASKIAKEKPVGGKITSQELEKFKKELWHLSKDEMLEKLLATYLRENQ